MTRKGALLPIEVKAADKRVRNRMKKKIIVATAILTVSVIAAAVMIKQNRIVAHDSTSILSEGDTQMNYTSITMEEAKEIFASGGDYIILDVRRADEFTAGHIPGAINVANEDIADTQPAELPDKDQVIYVYCRSGNRSKQASAKLAAMGYANIIEFGGIVDWTGQIEK